MSGDEQVLPVPMTARPETLAARRAVFYAAAGVLIVLPWVNPLAFGPSPAVSAWLLSAACALALLWLAVCRPACFRVDKLGVLLAWSLLLAALLSSAIGLFQYSGLAGAFSPWISNAALGEAYGNLRQRNQFASLSNIGLAALIWLALRYSAGGTRHGASRTGVFLLVAAGCLLATGNAASSSRTGMVQIFMICALCGFWGVWRTAAVRHVLIAAVLTYVVAALALPLLAALDPTAFGLAARLRDASPVCASRLTLWANVLQLIAEKPWLGWGWGELDYAHYSTSFNGMRFCELLDNAHNLPLQLAVETGLPAALLVCAAFTAWVLRRRPWRETDPSRQFAWSAVFLIVLHSMLEYPLWYGPFQLTVLLCAVVLWPLPAGAAPASRELPWRRAGLLAAVLLTVVLSYAGWDYRRVSQIYLAPEARDPAYRSDTLAKIAGSRLFANQVGFAQLLTTPLTPGNADWTYSTAQHLLHFSPEPRVAEKLIESAVMLGRDQEAVAQLALYRAAYPEEYARWAAQNRAGAAPAASPP